MLHFLKSAVVAIDKVPIPMILPQARVKAVAQIVGGLVAGVREGRDVNLNDLKV